MYVYIYIHISKVWPTDLGVKPTSDAIETIYICIYVYIHIQIYLCMCTYVCIYMYTHI
jgi:hypothetical protein